MAIGADVSFLHRGPNYEYRRERGTWMTSGCPSSCWRFCVRSGKRVSLADEDSASPRGEDIAPPRDESIGLPRDPGIAFSSPDFNQTAQSDGNGTGSPLISLSALRAARCSASFLLRPQAGWNCGRGRSAPRS